MNDKTEVTMKQMYDTLEYLGTELLKSQQATREAIVSLAEAIAGVRQAKAVTPPAPESKPAAQPSAQPEPIEAPKPVSIDEVREVFADKSRAGHKDALKALLDSYGAKKLPDLAQDKLAEVLAKAQTL